MRRWPRSQSGGGARQSGGKTVDLQRDEPQRQGGSQPPVSARLLDGEKVTNVSGRGVGMDVVKRQIDLLRGSLPISSEEGTGHEHVAHLPTHAGDH